ncbi:MAG: type II toxin-antitoxin system VapB family antitoxin [Candidatus Aminicenantes bacterium]|nr:type II toxin-antitoxin system VapB family antitoxin [Candidatus Aminicenantes bacterium]
MRTTVWIRDDLMKEAEKLSGAKSMKKTIDVALEEYVRRRKAMRLLDLEGRVEMDLTPAKLRALRKKDVPR